jgi:phenylpyruvate tautomerase PptA (4-oxalocrotonate tautomerase family)
MPVIDFQSPLKAPPPRLFSAIVEAVSGTLSLPEDRVWILWHQIAPTNYFRKNWFESKDHPAPIVRLRFKSEYVEKQRERIIEILVQLTSEHCVVDANDIYVVADPVQKGLLFVRGELWI